MASPKPCTKLTVRYNCHWVTIFIRRRDYLTIRMMTKRSICFHVVSLLSRAFKSLPPCLTVVNPANILLEGRKSTEYCQAAQEPSVCHAGYWTPVLDKLFRG